MTTRTQLPLIILLSFSILTVSAQSATKTFTKSFYTAGKTFLKVDLPGQVDMKVWDNPSIKVEINVNLPAGNIAMLNGLANVGRYNLTAKTVQGEDVMMINAPNMQKQVKIKGEPLREVLYYTVYVPRRMSIEMPNALTLADVKK